VVLAHDIDRDSPSSLSRHTVVHITPRTTRTHPARPERPGSMTAQQPTDAHTSARCIPRRLTDATVQDTMASSCELTAVAGRLAVVTEPLQRRRRSHNRDRLHGIRPFVEQRLK